MKLGEKQVLTVVKAVEFGVYLGSDEERVLLPKKQVPEGIEIGDPVEVFLYKDSSDRMIATTREPKLTLGGLAVLDVVDVGRVGAFLDWGLEKDLLLPYKEQTEKVEKGDRCLVSLYIDKSGRLCATMKISSLLRTDSPYQKNDMVQGTVYGINREYGVYVAVDNQFSAMIPRREVYGRMQIGQQVEARVAAVKADGKLDLSVRGRIPELSLGHLRAGEQRRKGVAPGHHHALAGDGVAEGVARVPQRPEGHRPLPQREGEVFEVAAGVPAHALEHQCRQAVAQRRQQKERRGGDGVIGSSAQEL